MKVFEEEQRFSIYIYVSLLVSFLVVTILSFREWQHVLEKNLWEMIVHFSGSIIVFLIALLFVFFKLKTRVDKEGVHYQFLPIHFLERTIIWNDISSCYVRKYNPIVEYGGWGIRGFRKTKRAYNTKGNIGLYLVLKNGNKLLIGTQMKTEMEQVLKTYYNK